MLAEWISNVRVSKSGTRMHGRAHIPTYIYIHICRYMQPYIWALTLTSIYLCSCIITGHITLSLQILHCGNALLFMFSHLRATSSSSRRHARVAVENDYGCRCMQCCWCYSPSIVVTSDCCWCLCVCCCASPVALVCQ